MQSKDLSPQKGLARSSPMKSSRKPSVSSEGDAVDRVKVCIRIRPSLSTEQTGAIEWDNNNKMVLQRDEHASVRRKEYTFDKVFDPSTDQQGVFQEAVKPIINDVLSGYNAALLAYGQTGAGKTFTMANTNPSSIGMIPRAAAALLEATVSEPESWNISMSFIQVYQEKIHDLLQPTNTNLTLREDANGEVFISDIHRVPIQKLEDALNLLQTGFRNRATAATNLNEVSSRSHAVVIFDVLKKQDLDTGVHHVQAGKMFMVDLAGSERLKKSGSLGQRADEARAINLSLTTLGKCIAARATASEHVPFRESKLTRLLQGALSGSAKTVIIVSVCDAVEHVEETGQALAFGSQARRVVVTAQVNSRVEYNSLDPGLQGLLTQTGQKAALLERTLLSRETALRDLQAELQKEQDQSRRVIEALTEERFATEEAARRELERADKEAKAAAIEKESLLGCLKAKESEVTEVNARVEQLEVSHAEERHLLMSEVQAALATIKSLENQLQSVENKLQQERTSHALAIQSLEITHTNEVTKLQNTLKSQASSLEQANTEYASSINQLESTLSQREEHIDKLTQLVRCLEATLSEEQATISTLMGQNSDLKETLKSQQSTHKAVKADYERQIKAQYKLAQAFLELKRREAAARTIQRFYRRHITRCREQALTDAKLALGNMEARRMANLAFSGQTLIGECVSSLQEAGQSLLTTFLVPTKDLKTINKYANKAWPQGSGQTSSMLAEALISAFRPLETSPRKKKDEVK